MNAKAKKTLFKLAMEVSGRKVDEILCEPCGDNGQKLLAAGFCVDCCEFLCITCYKHHCTPRAYRKHVLQDEKTMPRTKPDSTTTESTNTEDKCSKHRGEIIKFYCRSDHQLGCGSCMITNHRRCEELLSIEEEYEKFDKEIQDFGLQLDNSSSTKDQNSIEIEKHHSQAVKDIKLLMKDIKEYIENLENQMISNVDKVKDEDKKKMESISATCTALRNDLQSLSSDLSKLHQSQKNGKLFTSMEEARNQMKTIAKYIDGMSCENKVLKYTFVPEKQIEDLIGNVTALGKLDISVEPYQNDKTKILESADAINTTLHATENASMDSLTQTPIQTKATAPLTTIPSSNVSSITTAIKQFKPRQLSETQDITVKSSTDKQIPYVTGIAMLDGDQLVLADFNYYKVKLVNTKQNKIVTEIDMSSPPWDITVVNNNLVAVTMHNANQIQLVSVSNSNLSQGQTIKVKGKCSGIVYYDGKFIMTYTLPGKIEIISMNGNVLKVIDKGPNGETLFVDPRYIAISPDNTHVYISDNDKHTVTYMTLDGNVKGIYKDESLRYPHGLTVDKSGSVYVACGGFNIYQISGDCSQGQELQGSGLEHLPCSITYCHKEDKLYVGYYNMNIIKVFQLK